MFDVPIFQRAKEYHFMFQKGMYFSGQSAIQGAMIVYSDTVEDFFWNYALQIRVQPSQTAALVDRVEKHLRGRDRVPCFYLTPWTEPRQKLQALLQERGYSAQFRDAWMFLDPTQAETNLSLTPSAHGELNIQKVDDPADFLEVFAKAYGGEPSEDDPYGGLPAYYLEALKQSFALSRKVNTFHFVAYVGNEQPVAIATLISKDKWGGIYNVGTIPGSRGKGYGTAISHACMDKWRRSGGKMLFLQTETGSKVETWYSSMGFVTRFVGEGWAPVE